MEDNAGLLLEGGGMRSAYTAGVLDLFLDKGIEFPYVATASSGSLIGSSYIAKQRDRNSKIIEVVGNNPESVSIVKLLRDKEIFGMDYIFDRLPRELVPLDFTAFRDSPSKFIIGTTDIKTGNPIHFDHYDTIEALLTIIRASCSLPVLAPSVLYNGYELMDGGVSDPIPIQPLIDKGLKKHVVVLTRNKGYVKKATKLNWFFKRIFKEKPELIKLLRDRHNLYNQTMQGLLEMEKRNEVFIIQPKHPLVSGRFERNKQKLNNLYIQGYTEAEEKLKALDNFLKMTTPAAEYLAEHIPS